MDLDAFDHTPGRLEVGSKGYFYYVPPAMPRSLGALSLSDRTIELLSTADRHVGRLDGVGDLLPNAQLLIQPYVRKEAVLSSRIEGTRADVADLAVEELDGDGSDGTDLDVREVGNYVRALNHGLRHLKTGRIDLNLLCRMHERLLEGVRGEQKDPGRFRDVQVFIGGSSSSIETATYVPPEPRVMQDCLREFEQYLLDPPALPPLIQCGLAHYWFEAIHPFRDGNGRIGRTLIQLMLMERNIMRQPLLYLSAFFEKRRNDYYDHLQAVSTSGAYDEWLAFFLEGVASQAKDGVEKSRAILDLQTSYHSKLKAAGANQAAHVITDHVFEKLALTTPRAAKHADVSFQTAQRAIEDYLIPAGILVEVTGQKRHRKYLARELVRLLEE